MGEVYRARDSRLGREVAVKVLPEHLSANPDIRARFEREAKTVSGLNHPNICTLFDVGREGDIDYLVMELVEGDTLAEKLKRGPMATAELVRIGVQVSDALDRAHRAGVVHRDLKPGNIMLTRSGAKLMDFGLARAVNTVGRDPVSGHTLATLAQTPTALTAEGAILGTFQYMSPEQLEGKEADARSDIWALGCVLHEMATGKRTFEGRSQAGLIAAILEREPAPLLEAPASSIAPGSSTSGSKLPTGAPAGLDRLVRSCLTKDPEERIQTAHDVRLQLQWIGEGAGLSTPGVAPSVGAAAAAPAAPVSARSARLPWALAALFLLGAAGIFAWLYPQATAPVPSIRFRVPAPAAMRDTFWPRVSPNGKFLIFKASDSTGNAITYLRQMDEMDAHVIAGTEGSNRVYWSPDSKEIAFVLNDKIVRLPVGGGTPAIVCPATGGSDISWGSKGQILMDGSGTDSLRVVPAGGGELRPATRIYRNAGESSCGWPCFLPDGQHFLFVGIQNGNQGNIRLGTLGSLDSKLLGATTGRVEYAPGGWILFMNGTALCAQKLDLGAGKLTGQPITLNDRIRLGSSAGHFSCSESGVLAFARDEGVTNATLRPTSRAGTPLGAAIGSGFMVNPEVSPDGRRILYQKQSSQAAAGGDIYVYDLDRSTDTRLTFSGGNVGTPAWSPDGRQFAYSTRVTTGRPSFQIGAADGLGLQDSIPMPVGSAPSLRQWSASGSRLVYSDVQFKSFAIPTTGSPRTPQALVDSSKFAWAAEISPDGRWVAFVSGTPPNINVFVQSLTGTPGRWQISAAPGAHPVWTKGGAEIIWEGFDGKLMAADIDTKASFHAGTPHPVLTLPQPSFNFDLHTWACDAAGEKFYLVSQDKRAFVDNLEIVTNFSSLVNRK
jgi:Tol biopolymer transport system component